MQDTTLLQQALAIIPPWSVIRSTFDPVARRLDIHIDFAAGGRFRRSAAPPPQKTA